MDFARYMVSVRKFVVIRTARSLFLYTNFELATVLHRQTNRPQKIKQKMHHIGCIFYLTGCAVLEPNY